MERMNQMNRNIVEANVRLQDELKIMENDNKILKNRLDCVNEHLKSKMNKFKAFDLDKDIKDAIDMLEGTYVYEDGRKRKRNNNDN